MPKRKRGATDVQWAITYPSEAPGKPVKYKIEKHVSPFHARGQSPDLLNVPFTISPPGVWQSLKSYKRFIVQGAPFDDTDFVRVCYLPKNSSDSDSQSKGDDTSFWVAKILEVRAFDANHVFAMVVWLYRPWELPECQGEDEKTKAAGRRSYHGDFELIASNHVDIVDVTTFDCKIDVNHWLEEDDEDVQPALYWRQAFDHRTSKLTPLRKHCTCKTYYNPDTLMVHCPHCDLWIHADCLLDDILTKTYETTFAPTPSSPQIKTEVPSPGRTQSKLKESDSAEETSPSVSSLEADQHPKPYDGVLSARMVIEDDDKADKIEITDLRETKDGKGKVWSQSPYCLSCGAVLD